MYSFELNTDAMERMTAQFRIFMSDRERVQTLLEGYVADYRSFNGTALDRYEYLREKYKSIAANPTHLVYGEDGEIYWGAADISILLNKDSTSVTRTLRKIEEAENWRVRLHELRKLSDPGHVPPVYVYKEGVFEAIIDFYEEEYLQRFMKPRRGKAASDEEAAEIYRFWKYLKTKAAADKEIFRETSAITSAVELPDIPPMSLKEIIRLTAGKLFTIKMGAFLTVLSALGYELSRRWNVFYIILPVLSVCVFIFCALCIHRRKLNPGHLANTGAGALLLCFIWLVGSLAQDGSYISGGRSAISPFRMPEKPKMILDPSPREGSFYFNITVDDLNGVREYFYRIKPDTEYRSTGFMRQTNVATGLPFPNMSIPNEKNGIIEIDVKFSDLNGKERGPFSFKFDSEKLDLDQAKYFVQNLIKDWIRVRRSLPIPGVPEENISTFVEIDDAFFTARVRGAVEKIIYGVDKETPDTLFTGYRDNRRMLACSNEDSIQYASAQIFFKDGTSTDVRISQKRVY